MVRKWRQFRFPVHNIKKLKVSDEGIELKSCLCFIIEAKPEIIIGPRTQLVSVGTTVTLHCDVVSNPPATIAWTFPKVGIYINNVDLGPLKGI